MRRAAKVDSNHAVIVAALRAAGCSVLDLSKVGNGCPDILVACGLRMRLIEIKRPKAKGQRPGELTNDQLAFMKRWPVPVPVVDSVDQALAAMGLVNAAPWDGGFL